MPTYNLVPHPQYAAPQVTLRVHAAVTHHRVVEIEYTVTGAIADVVIPAPVGLRRQDELWRRTCFELFCGSDDSTGYHEFNFAPSGAYASYHFDDYRANMRVADDMAAPHTLFTRRDQRLSLNVFLDAAAFAPLGIAHMGLAAVLEARNGTKSYWALAHAPGPPDFHNPACFVATLSAPAAP